MSRNALLALSSIFVLGVSTQWLSWWLRIPSILLLLIGGIIAGPVTGFIDPTQLFGDLLLPIVSLSVAVILFEGGLSLKFHELRDIGGIFLRLTTLGVAVSWVVGTLAARWFLGFQWQLASLLGAILVVTGPTVIAPLLRHLRLGGQVGSILKWEGIVIDPVGAMLAVMVFSTVRSGAAREAAAGVVSHFVMTLLIGAAIGLIGALVLGVALKRYWIPDSLQNPVSLMIAVAAHTSSNLIQNESGLLAVTVMGVALANQKQVAIRHLVEFKENLTVLLISALFIILAARLRLEDLATLRPGAFLFVAAILMVARPASVLASTVGSSLSWRERIFLSCMAPRGIVAVAISSVFGLEMLESGFTRADEMVPVTFLVVFCTVLIYGLSAAPLAHRLGLVKKHPRGFLIVGAHPLARRIAAALNKEKCPVLLVDTAWENIRAARMAGLSCQFGSILAEQTMSEIEFGEMGRMLALTANNELNSLACLRYVEVFGRREVYQLSFGQPTTGRHEAASLEQRGRMLWRHDLTYNNIYDICGDSPEVKLTALTKEFDYTAFVARFGNATVPLILLRPGGEVVVYTTEGGPTPEPGDFLLSLQVPAVTEEALLNSTLTKEKEDLI